MDQHKKIITTQVIEDVVNKSSSDRISIRDLVEAMEAAGFGLTMMIFAFAVLIPLPPPIPSIISLPLLVFSAQMLLGYTAPRLPKKFTNITVKRSVIATVVQKSSPYIRKIERILRHRISFMFLPVSERIIGAFAFSFSAFIAIPLPFTNFVPGLGILIMSFGLLGKDGLLVIIGIMVGIIGVIIATMAIILGVGAVLFLKGFFV